MTTNGYITKDSVNRQKYSSGMHRDTQQGKPRYDLIDREFLRRWADLMARGAEKYGEDNWRLAATEEELKRFQGSALRHMMQWLDGDDEKYWVEASVDPVTGERSEGYWGSEKEDHAAAVAFNVAAAEMVKSKLAEGKNAQHEGQFDIKLDQKPFWMA